MSDQRLGLGAQLLRRKPIIFQRHFHPGTELPRKLGTFQLMMFGVGATVGTGIFFVLSEAIPVAGPAVIISFLLAGLAAGLSALCYAELSSSIPVSGSTYSFSYHALGEGVAVLVGGCVLLEYGLAVSAVAVGWSGYFNELLRLLFGFQLPTELSISFIPGDDGVATGGIVNLPAIVLVGLCMLLLIRGAAESATINAIMVCIKLGVLVLFIVIGLGLQCRPLRQLLRPGRRHQWSGRSDLLLVHRTRCGRDRRRRSAQSAEGDPPRHHRRPVDRHDGVRPGMHRRARRDAGGVVRDTGAGEAGLAKIMELVTGTPIWATILSAGAVISVFSVTLVTLYGQTRILFSISRDGMVSRKFLAVSPKHGTPVYNTIVVSILVALVAGFVPSDYLWDSVSFGTLVAFSVVAISLIVLRRRDPELERPFKVPLYPVVPILTVAVCIYVLVAPPDHLDHLPHVARRRVRLLPHLRQAPRHAERLHSRRGDLGADPSRAGGAVTYVVGYGPHNNDRSAIELRVSSPAQCRATCVRSPWFRRDGEHRRRVEPTASSRRGPQVRASSAPPRRAMIWPNTRPSKAPPSG